MRKRKIAPDPAAAQILLHVRNHLLDLHKTLLDSERSAYERDVAPVESPGQMLGLLMGDPWFAYLRELSQFVARVDEILDASETPTTVSDAVRILNDARALLRPSENGREFERRYFEAMQRDPDVVLAHAAATRALERLAP